MSDINSTSRESKKRQLRGRIVSAQPASEQGPQGGYEEDSQEVIHRAHGRVVRRRMKIALVLLLLAGAGAFFLYRYVTYHEYTDYQVVWETDFTASQEDGVAQGSGNFCGYTALDGGILKYTRDGMSYMDTRGKVIWNKGYEMKTPIVAVNGSYAAVADQQGNQIYICSKDGCQGEGETLLPIQRVTVSAQGVAAVIETDSSASYIDLFKRDGSSLKISVKSLLEKDGYPIDLSLSPAGTQMAVSFLYLDQGMLRCKLVFYNFGLGQDLPNRVVGIFTPEAIQEGMVAKVQFMDESHAAAFSDKGLNLVSTRVETSPELLEPITVEQEIRTICCSDQYAGLITENTEGEDPYRLQIYDKDGELVTDRTFQFPYENIRIIGDNIYLYNENACEIYNKKGVRKFAGEFDFTVSGVFPGSFPGSCIVAGPQTMKEIRLQ